MDSERGWTLLFWSMIVLGVLAVLFRGGEVEQDLTERANAALHENGLQWASVKEASGRNLVLTGESPVQEFRNLPKKMVAGLFGVRNVADEDIIVKDPVSPYVWQAVIEEGSVTLKGSVPDEETRGLIVRKARQLIYDRPVIDKMVLADGSPDSGWLDNISSVLKYTRYLKSGVISLEDRSVKVEGEAWNLLDHEIITLRTGRGKAIGDYKFSSKLSLPGEVVKKQETSDAEAAKTVESEAPGKPGEPGTMVVSEKQPPAPENIIAGDKETSGDVAAAPVAGVLAETGDSAENEAETDKSAGGAASAAPGGEAVSEPLAATQKDAPPQAAEPQASPAKPSAEATEKRSEGAAAGADNAEPVEPSPAKDERPAEKTAEKTPGEAVAGPGGDKDRAAPAGYYYVPGPYGAPVAVPLNVPPFMIAPPWAFSPYRARPAYPPGCAYLHPGNPAYCGRALY